jgi:hypothetical protein
MDYRFVKSRYLELRRQQASMQGRELTPIDHAAGDVVFNVAALAAMEVASGCSEVAMRAVSLSTGTGKSTSAYAFIAACAQAHSDFSAAYVVPTVKMGEEAQHGIEQLLGENTSTLWSWCHKHNRKDEEAIKRELGHLPTRLVDRAELKSSRIIIVTHQMLRSETLSGRDIGVRKFNGQPRSVVFVDEHPELLDVVSIMPAQLQVLHDKLAARNPAHDWLPILSGVVSRMNAVMHGDGQTYVATPLLSLEEGAAFENGTRRYLFDLTDQQVSTDLREHEADNMLAAVSFLLASSKGCAFYSRIDKSFFAYRLVFDPGYPGYVLLDATSDITGLVTLHPNVRSEPVPQVNYSNLEIFHMRHPKEFHNVGKVTRHAKTGEAYGAWIRSMVLANTVAGDDVLIVTHKSVLDLAFVEGANDPSHPADWEGRKVNTQNWGAGIGLNKFKHKGTVFLFAEFYPKRAQTIGETHGWSGLAVHSDQLRDAQGRRQAGDEFAPQGLYLKPYEGHLLRWTKQLSMRGAARNIDAHGKCHPMKLFTSMSLNRLLRHFDRLFPGANPPQLAQHPAEIQTANPALRGRDALIAVLMKGDKSVYGADEIQRLTGIRTFNLSRDFRAESVQAVAGCYGWQVQSARQLGKSGKMNYVVLEPGSTRERLMA